MPGRILSVQQTAERLRVKPRTIRDWIVHGKLVASKVGRAYAVQKCEVERMLTAEKPVVKVREYDPTRAERLSRIKGILRGTDVSVDLLIVDRKKQTRLQRRRAERCA